ncbi:MAG: bifunctional UDP-sugar hydrolase/5'-nucleotidase [Kiritimatiellia bacterium]
MTAWILRPARHPVRHSLGDGGSPGATAGGHGVALASLRAAAAAARVRPALGALSAARREISGLRGVGLSFIAILLLTPALTAREVAITLLHTADVHGHVAAVANVGSRIGIAIQSGSVEPQLHQVGVEAVRENGKVAKGLTSERAKEPGAPDGPGGGLLRCATRIAEIRRQEPNVILLDCGDLIQGSPESFLTHGRIVVEAVRQLRYDALVPGNHEFDGGVDALRRFYTQAKIPVLAANIGGVQDPALPGMRPFLCKDVDGVRVAIVGLSNPLIPKWSRPRLLGDVTVEASLVALRRLLPLVRAQKPDILVLAVHQGWREWGDDPANEIRAIAQAFPEFDVILGAHTHQSVEWKTVNGVAYSQAGCYGLWLGVARLVFDTQAKRIKSKQMQLLAVDSGVAPDKTLADLTAKSLEETKIYLNQEVGVAAVELKPKSRARGQSAIQTLIALAIAERVQADVVIHRALSEESLRAGRITMRDVWRIVPYDNYIGVAHLTPDELRQILEENSAYFASREFRGVYGLTYDLKPKAAAGERVSNIRLASECRMKNAECGISGGGTTENRRRTPDAGRKADDGECGGRSLERQSGRAPDKRVRVAFNSYDMASAGGRFPRLRAILEQSASRLEEYPDADTRAAVLAYLRAHQPLDIQAAPGAHVVRAPK